MPELITISIPTHRRPSLLLHALYSCLLQEYRPLEIDISDDSPSAETEAIVRSLTLPEGISLRYWRNSPSLGQAGNVNKLFAEARGAKLILLHDDDALMPGAVSVLHDAFSWSDFVVASYGLQLVITENGESSLRDRNSINRTRRTPDSAGLQEDVIEAALYGQFPNNGYLVKTELARAVGYRGKPDVGEACDLDFSIRLAFANRDGAFAFVNQYTSQYRLTSFSLRSTHDVCWKAFDQVSALRDLTPNQVSAQQYLLRRLAEEAVVDNACHYRRLRALQLFFSSFYPKRKLTLKAAYHLGLIAMPKLSVLRERLRAA